MQRALDDLQAAAESLCAREGGIEIRLAGDFIFVNQTRLRLGLDNFAAFSGFVTLMKSCGVGLLRADDGVTRREWQALLSILAALPPALDPEDRFELLMQRIQQADIVRLAIGPTSKGALALVPVATAMADRAVKGLPAPSEPTLMVWPPRGTWCRACAWGGCRVRAA